MAALDVLDDPELGAIRIEGVDDIVDIELLGTTGLIAHVKQVKTRVAPYTWGEAELVKVLRRWGALPGADQATFEFLTDGRLGPTGTHVQTCLRQASAGDPEALAALLSTTPHDPLCTTLTRADIREDRVSSGALRARAERQVRAMLPDARNAADAQERATHAVLVLFQMLFERAADPAADRRVVSRQEIADTLGVPADQPSRLRWPGSLQRRALDAAAAVPLETTVAAVVAMHESAPRLRRSGRDDGGDPQVSDLSVLLSAPSPVMLSGRTGTGKSTTAGLLCQQAAASDHLVLVTQAEAYLPGRLSALAADALSALLGIDVPASTGRQVLSDPDVTIVIDGASEIPASFQADLHQDLLANVAAHRGARITVVGRDVAVLRQILPSTVTPSSFCMVDLDPQRRQELARRTLLPEAADPLLEQQAHELATIVAQLDRALGDATGNPLLFTMGLTLLADGIPFTNPASLYEAFVERLAARSGSAGVVATSVALGAVFARLLDDGRRYADPYEWAGLLAKAAQELTAAGIPMTGESLDASARRVGLVTPIRYTQTVVPMHDSFADYLAGLSHARRGTPLPAHLQPGDDQRVLFAAEIGGVDESLAALATRNRPFLAVRLAALDTRDLGEDAPSQVQALLINLLADTNGPAVTMWRTDDGRVVAARAGDDTPAWVDATTGKHLLTRTPCVVVNDRGPLNVAVRLWRQNVADRLRTTPDAKPSLPSSLDAARLALEEHASRTATALRELVIAVAPTGGADELTARIGPLGLTASVAAAQQGRFGSTWPVTYRRTDTVSISNDTGETDAADAGIGAGHTSVEAMLSRSPEATAAGRICKALNDLTAPHWL